ncbi:MAG: putative DNA-binding domain-containing protein [Gammaproteobacteria bacterium]|nr:putative DNA-binding domain-containing protein [Gammaproteobacteria bacterium]
MTSLKDLQKEIRDAVFAKPSDNDALETASQHIHGDDRITADEHLLIYRQAILSTLISALESIHPVCRQLIGEQFFDAMARRYVRQSPSKSPDLGDYGADFSDFIAGFEPAQTLPYLADVARLEWAWHQAFHAPDETGSGLAELANVSGQDTPLILFKLPLSASLLESAYPIHKIWQVNQDDWQEEPSVNLDDGQVRLIVWRQHYDIRIDPLTDQQLRLLKAVKSRRSLEEISASEPGLPLDQTLPQCVKNGWLASFSLKQI